VRRFYLLMRSKKIDNIIATVDYNGKQIDGPVDSVVNFGRFKCKSGNRLAGMC
jgi:transketolase N-terminal domain/subunit